MNENLNKRKPKKHSALTQVHFDIAFAHHENLCNTLIITCPLVVIKSSFMKMSDHLFKSFLGFYLLWGKNKIPYHILKRHGFGIKVLQI